MLYLDFSHNWNCKLLNQCFSTLRLWNDDKYIVNQVFRCRLEQHKEHLELGNVRLIQRTRLTLDKLSENMALLDTGYTAPETRAIIQRMYKAKFEKEGMAMEMGFYIFRWESRVPGYFQLLERSIIKPYDKILETEAAMNAADPEQQLELSI